ncbi:uncharacterized protein LOC116255688 isoform X1 [Nymphaea colorata]|nr:uncharacterized protein LOC116255688 isoform X1 [Nymphaea colorata]
MAGQKPELELEDELHSVVNDRTEDSLIFSDAEDHSWRSPADAADSDGGCHEEEYRYSNDADLEMGGVVDIRRNSTAEYSDVDLENGGGSGLTNEMSLHLAKVERDCRICHLTLEGGAQESELPIELGCSCKDDLAAAHKQCAEAWFKIKGNKTCEICGSVARNVVGVDSAEFMEQWNEVGPPAAPQETRCSQHGHRLLNFLLACVVFAFVISWLFHFNVPS